MARSEAFERQGPRGTSITTHNKTDAKRISDVRAPKNFSRIVLPSSAQTTQRFFGRVLESRAKMKLINP
jgi:hypothetical protein